MRFFLLLMAGILLLAGCIQAPPEAPPQGEDGAPETAPQQDNGTARPGYVPFTKAAYDQAKAEGKVIFLEFYANWCPICASQEPEIIDAFGQIDHPDVAGFRVNYKDSDTDDDERELAREFGIIIQHTHIVLDSQGEVASRSSSVWQKEQIISEIEDARGA